MMKNLICIFICGCLLLGFTACNKNIVLSDDTPSNLDNMKIDEKYYPKFTDIEEGKSSLKSLVYGSIGWNLNNRQTFLFAVNGRYVLRYSMEKKEVDKIIDLGESYNGWPFGNSFSTNGRYSISKSFDFGGELSRNFFLIDFETEKVELLCDVYDEKKVNEIIDNKIPNEIKSEIDKGLILNTPKPNTDCSIEEKISTEDAGKPHYYFRDKNGNQKEITGLQMLNGGGSYCIIDENKIGAILPTEIENYELGYYRIIVIDIAQNKIVQEYILNTK